MRKESEDVLTKEERGGLTIWGEAISAQIRTYDDKGQCLALYIRPDAPRSPGDGNPVEIGPGDVAKLRALLDEAWWRAG